MELLRDRLINSAWRNQVRGLRIGGNDLLNLLGIRRGRGVTIYDTPLRNVIADLACIFLPAGYHLAAPLFDYLDAPEILGREVALDLLHGLTGKTAIHPAQIAIIEKGYQVNHDDYAMALAILAPDATAVFRLHNVFCEPVTHRCWAMGILERARIFGVV
jgi:citrate lyase beta subunit